MLQNARVSKAPRHCPHGRAMLSAALIKCCFHTAPPPNVFSRMELHVTSQCTKPCRLCITPAPQALRKFSLAFCFRMQSKAGSCKTISCPLKSSPGHSTPPPPKTGGMHWMKASMPGFLVPDFDSAGGLGYPALCWHTHRAMTTNTLGT